MHADYINSIPVIKPHDPNSRTHARATSSYFTLILDENMMEDKDFSFTKFFNALILGASHGGHLKLRMTVHNLNFDQ